MVLPEEDGSVMLDLRRLAKKAQAKCKNVELVLIRNP